MGFAGGGPWRRAFRTAAELGDVFLGGRGIGGTLIAGLRSLAAQFWLGKALGGTLFAWRQSLVARFWEGVALAAHFSLGDGGDRRRSFRRRRRGLAAQFWAMAELGDTFFMWRPSLAPQFWRGCGAWRPAQFWAALLVLNTNARSFSCVLVLSYVLKLLFSGECSEFRVLRLEF